jgi:hypothetical protein
VASQAIPDRVSSRLKNALTTGRRVSFALSIWQATVALTGLLASFSGRLTARISPEVREQAVKTRSSAGAFRNTQSGVKYVGSEACAPCHADICKTFKNTGMGRSMLLAGNRTQLGLVPIPSTVHDLKLDRYFQVSADGPDLYQSEYQLASDGREVFRETEKLEYILGAGENGFSYIVRRGQYLFEAPLSYYSKLRRWQVSPSFEFVDYGFGRPILTECLSCHSGRSRPIPGRDGMYEGSAFEELAIGCENCHGPGQLHIEERRKAVPLSSGTDNAIVNPAKLPTGLPTISAWPATREATSGCRNPPRAHSTSGLEHLSTAPLLFFPFLRTRAQPEDRPCSNTTR